MVLEKGTSECIEGEVNQEQERVLSEKQVFLNNMLNSGIEITSESEFNKISEILLKENIHDLSGVSFLDISKTGKPFAMKRMNTDENTLTIFSLYSVFNLNEDGPFSKGGTITNGGVFELELSRDINYLKSNNNQFQILMNQYNNAQGEVMEVSKEQLCQLDDEIDIDSNIEGEGNNSGFDITYDNPIQSLEEIATGVISGKTDIDGTDDEVLVTEDVLDNDINQADLPVSDKQVEEKDKKETYTVKKTDTIWDILQTEQFGFTEKQANVAIKKLEKNSDFLSKLRSKTDIHKIYPGETITFSNELLSSLKAQEKIPEVEKGTWSYNVEKGDTPSHILMKYKGVNWGNVEDIAKELNMSVVKLGETITLAKTITLKNGTIITKTDS